MLGFFSFFWAGLVAMLFVRSPQVRTDNEGITAFPHPFWRRRARWKNVAQCEIRTIFNYLGQGPMRFFIFRSATGRVLLHLIPGSLAGLSTEEQAEIEREIRRRLANAPRDEATPET